MINFSIDLDTLYKIATVVIAVCAIINNSINRKQSKKDRDKS
jgi:hypothetical protein